MSDFILSERFHTQRHVLFWLTRYLIHVDWWAILHILNGTTPRGCFAFPYNLAYSGVLTMIEMSYSYGAFHIFQERLVIPRFQPLLIRLCMITIITFFAFYALHLLFPRFVSPWLGVTDPNDSIYECYRYGDPLVSLKSAMLLMWDNLLRFVVVGPPMVGSIFMAVKVLKAWYKKEEEKIAILKEKAQAELQLLKAQIHPHFLFNTLNNIYASILNQSSQAGVLVHKLANTLQYMVTDCEAALVPLEKEMQMIRDYIGLEQVRYGDRLVLEVEINGNCKDKLVTPLLLIPFVENSFKHGASRMLLHPWVSLHVIISENELQLNLSNSKASHEEETDGKGGIGLLNVKKRLELLYPDMYEMQINSGSDFYSIHLKIPLFKNIPEEDPAIFSLPQTQTTAYAGF